MIFHCDYDKENWIDKIKLNQNDCKDIYLDFINIDLIQNYSEASRRSMLVLYICTVRSGYEIVEIKLRWWHYLVA